MLACEGEAYMLQTWYNAFEEGGPLRAAIVLSMTRWQWVYSCLLVHCTAWGKTFKSASSAAGLVSISPIPYSLPSASNLWAVEGVGCIPVTIAIFKALFSNATQDRRNCGVY